MFRSLTLGIETTRKNYDHTQILTTAEKYMVRKMMRLKRKPVRGGLEPWLDWQIRSLDRAGDTIQTHDCNIIRDFLDARENWARHIARFGTSPDKQQNILKGICVWRCCDWQINQKNSMS